MYQLLTERFNNDDRERVLSLLILEELKTDYHQLTI